MKIFLFAFILISPNLSAQYINCKVIDKSTKEPLVYAIISYGKQSRITFSDTFGNFFLIEAILKESDSLNIEFIGYKTLTISNNFVKEGKVFSLIKIENNLQEVIVKNCVEYNQTKIDYDYKINSYCSATPNTKVLYAGYYKCINNYSGYISQIKIKTVGLVLIRQDFSIPMRIRWFEWDKNRNLPGKELTDTSIIFNVSKHGWNTIAIPDRRIYFEEEGIVIGLELIYPSEVEKKYLSFTSLKERQNYFNNHTWSFAVANGFNNIEGFIGHGGNKFTPFPSFNNNNRKPALNFVVKICKR